MLLSYYSSDRVKIRATLKQVGTLLERVGEFINWELI